MAGRWVGGEVRQRKPSKRERERERERVRAKPKRGEGGGSMVAGGCTLMEVRTMDLLDMARAKPKSQSFTVPFAPIRMFCGFMSRWMMPLEWR